MNFYENIEFENINKKYIYNYEYIPEENIQKIQNKINKIIIQYYKENNELEDEKVTIKECIEDLIKNINEDYENGNNEEYKKSTYLRDYIHIVIHDNYYEVKEKIGKYIKLKEEDEDEREDRIDIEDIINIKEKGLMKQAIKYLDNETIKKLNTITYE